MKKTMIAFASFFWMALAANVQAQAPEQPHIIIQAEGVEYTLPDQVTLSLTLENVSPHLSKARDNVERRSEQLLRAIRSFNLDDKDIEAGQVRIQPEYRWENNKREQIGTKVSRVMQFRIRDLNEYPDVLDAVFSAKVDSMAQVVFSHSQADALQQKSLASAVLNAKDKAERMARQLGQKVGKAFTIEEVGTGRPMPVARKEVMMMADSAPQPQADYQPGEIAFKSQVRIVFFLR